MNKKSAKYRRIGKKLIDSLPSLEDIREVRIAFLASDVEKKKDGKLVFADCSKVNQSRYDWTCPFDFFITVYEPNILDFNEVQLRALIHHELLHIGVNNEGTEPSFYVVPHDIEDFWEVLNTYGMNWQESEDNNAERR